MEAMAATAAMEATARGQLMPRLTTVVAMEATAMEAMAATAAMEAMARGQLMPRLTTVVAMEATAMEAMAAMDMATESNSRKEQIPHNLAPPNLIPDSQSVNPNLKLLYHELNPLEIQFQLKSCN